MSELFNNLPEKGEYKYNADDAGERAEGYACPDGTSAIFSMNAQQFCQRTGLFRLPELGDEAFDEKTGNLTEYTGMLDDMALVLFAATRTPTELAIARFGGVEVILQIAGFFDDRDVKFGTDDWLAWEKVFFAMVQDAYFAEAEPTKEDGGEVAGDKGKPTG